MVDIVEAIDRRKAIRAFKADPVPQDILREILRLALRAPSCENTQPWEFAVVSGSKIEEIREAVTGKIDEKNNSDMPLPGEYTEPFKTRRRAIGIQVYQAKGIQREDKDRRKLWRLQGLRFFEAPAVIYIYIDRSLYFQGDIINSWSIFDCGLVAGNIMLLSTKYGLGTIPQMQAVLYPDLLRGILDIPDTKLIVIGIAIGYPDMDDPVNQFRTERADVDEVAKWHGFD